MTARRFRRLVVAAALVAALGVAGAVTGIRATESAWTDRTYVSAVATGGTWSVPVTVGCVAMNPNGEPKPGGRCSVTSVTVEAEWGTNGSRMRNYTAYFNSNAQDGYVQFTIDLSTATGSGPFSWATAGLTAGSSQVIPASGWTCASLPTLKGKTPTGWGWGPNSSIFFQITENRSTQPVKCS